MGGRAPTADILISLAKTSALFHTPEGIGFADIDINGHRETGRSKAVGSGTG
jgi:hypothetical protein